MRPFPAQWHHLAVEDPFNCLSYPLFLRPACFSHPIVTASLVISPWPRILRQLPRWDSLSLSLFPPSLAFSAIRSPHASPSACLSLPRPSLLHPVSLLVTDSSAPQEHWGEQRKQRFGSVALILIFCRLDGRLGGAFIHTPHNHFPLQLQTMTADHRGCSYQHKCAICDKASLCFLPKTMTSLGTQCTEHRSQRSWCGMQDGKEERTQCNAYEPKINTITSRQEGRKKLISLSVASLFCCV